MNAGIRCIGLVAGAAAAMGCATTSSRVADLPFAEDWHYREQRDLDFERRKQRIRGNRGDAGAPRSGPRLEVDEEGKPKVRMGGLEGVQFEVDYDRGASAELGYKVEWDFAKPKRGKGSTR